MGSTESGWLMGGCIFSGLLSLKSKTSTDGKIVLLDEKIPKLVQILLSGTSFLQSKYKQCWNHEYAHSKTTEAHEKLFHTQSFSRKVDCWILFPRRRIWSRIPLYGFGTIVCKSCLQLSWSDVDITSQTRICLRFCLHTLLFDYANFIENNIVDGRKTPLLPCFPFVSKQKSGYIKSTGRYMS